MSLLTDVLNAEGHTVYIPFEVKEEVENRLKRNRWSGSGLQRALESEKITQIPEITSAQPKSLQLLSEVRKDHPAGTSGDRNMGECAVVTRALEASMAGTVVVAMDDGDAQTLAAARNTTNAMILGVYPLMNGSSAMTGASTIRESVRMLGNVQMVGPLTLTPEF